ncbi:7-methylguanosine phosphate-specific 5'-nucleotidase isoform 1-T1 [Hipposideros larvatus]
MPTLARVFALGKVALSNHNSLGPSPSSTQSPQPLSSASAPVFPERQPLRGYPAAGARGPPVFPAPSPLPQAGTTQAQCGRGGRSLSRHRPTGCEHHGGRGEAYGSIRSSAVLDPPGAPRPPVGHLGPAAPPWPVDAPGPAGAPAPSPVPPTRPLRVARASPGLPLGSAAVPESAVLSGFGTGEHPEEGHDPDAAARAGAGDRKRPPQRRGRPFTDILDNSKIISEECRKELKALLHHYYPIEIDPHRTIEEKLPHMVKWWTKAHDCLCQQKIQKFQIAEVVRESNAMLREGYKTFFNTLDQNNIPLLIFSAGIGDILEEIIRQMKVFHPNIHIVSNYMDFDKDGFLQGFKGQLIHTYNKNSSMFENSGYFQQLKGRTNIILLGDTMGDLTMADGVPGVENILKIGFLNDKVEEQRESYMDAYDIVLEKDETLDVVNGLLKHILHQGPGVEIHGS